MQLKSNYKGIEEENRKTREQYQRQYLTYLVLASFGNMSLNTCELPVLELLFVFIIFATDFFFRNLIVFSRFITSMASFDFVAALNVLAVCFQSLPPNALKTKTKHE